MADDFGLGDLTDDQLIELAQAVAMEFTRRDRSAYDAARAATRQARTSSTRATAGIDPQYDWAIARRAAMMIDETLGRDWTFSVWKGDMGERRVYFEADTRKPGAVRAKHRPHLQDSGGKVTFYVTGSKHHPPGDMDLRQIPSGIRRDRLDAIARFLEGAWDSWPTTRVSIALASQVTPAPVPHYYF